MFPRRAAFGALPLALLVLAAAPAAAQDTPDTFSLTFGTGNLKASTGYKVKATFPRQRIIDQVTVTLPQGTKIDTRAVTRCPLTSGQASGKGNVADQCPADSKVGTGKGTAFLGDATTPTTFDLDLYNTSYGALVDIKLGGQTAFTSSLTTKGRKQVIDLGLTKSLNARITAFDFSIKKAGTAKKPLVRTPAACPRNGKLAASLSARESGGGSETTKLTARCSR